MTSGEETRQAELLDAIAALDRRRVAELSDELIGSVLSAGDPYALGPARQVLGALRDHRHFVLLQRVADALLQAGRDDPVIHRQYAQALLDQGNLSAAVAVLERLLAGMSGPSEESAEARGLLGRAFKQMYVAAEHAPAERRRGFLERAIGEYRGVYEASREHRWHGINATALLARAERDGIALEGVERPGELSAALAREILAAIEELGDGRSTWDKGTAVEACVALGRTDQALEWLDAYLRDGMSAFAVGSTLRQLQEVWGLRPESEPGAHLIPLLQAELLRRRGGPGLELGTADVAAAAPERIEADPGFEKVLGDEGFETLRWFTTAIDRCRAAARVEHPLRGGIGTGFLVDGASLDARLPAVVLVTNAHVIGPGALAFDKAEITFRAIEGETGRYRVVRLLWTSPPHELDATIVELDSVPAGASRCPVAAERPTLDAKPSPRSYIVGHPQGVDQIKLSVRDNLMLDADERVLHYRTPTAPGSSGSPVFDDAWELIALHHSGTEEMPRLHGQAGTYPANEGIWIDQIVAALGLSQLD